MVSSNPRRLADRYEVRSLIGRGGMAQVHLGFDTRLSRVVAIKILRSDLARDAIFQARFRREAQAAASLNHPNIVGVYDTGEEMVTGADGAIVGVPFIVMEYVEGHTVKELLADGTPVPIDEAVEITAGVLSALEYSHAAGLVHRDIKPGNIMLTDDGKVKVMDFGIARAIADSQATMTQTNVVVGTAQYLSPEQARGEKVDARSDLYSAGCVLFELLTGRPPFKGDSAVSVAYQHVSEVPPAPSSIAGDIPESLDRVVMKAMAKDPLQRYATAAEMRQEMIRAAQGLAVNAPATDSWTAVTTAMAPPLAATQVYSGPTRSTSTTMAGIPGMEDVAELEQPPNKRRIWIIGLLILLALALVGGTLWAVLGDRMSGNGEPEMVNVPDALVGMSQTEARDAIETAGLVFSLGDPVASKDVEKGLVASTNPASGTSVEKGSTVVVALSSGPDSVEIPAMKGWDQERVRAELEGLGFTVGDIKTVDNSDVDEGGLVKTDPAMGTTQPVGTTVHLSFSSGKVEIPSLVGTDADDAAAQLSKLGLNVRIVSYGLSDEFDENQVVEMEPSGGSSVKTGSSVTLRVSEGRSVTVPDVTGLSEARAAADIADAGLKTGKITREFSDTVDEGTVISQNPGAGSASFGTNVDLVISKGPEPQPTPTPTPSETQKSDGQDDQ